MWPTFQQVLVAIPTVIVALVLLIVTGKREAEHSGWYYLRLGAVFLLCVSLFLLTKALLGFVFHPWSYTLTGRSTLTGGWSGRLVDDAGSATLVFLDLSLNMESVLGTEGGPCLAGRALLCRGDGQTAPYEIRGNATHRGAKLGFSVYTAPRRPDRQGLASMQGRWNGPTLTLAGDYQPGVGESLRVRGALTKSGKSHFEALCRRDAIARRPRPSP